MTDKPPVLVVLNETGAHCARTLRSLWPGAAVHGRQGRVARADYLFEDTAAHLRELFAGGYPVIGLCAAGILVRALAPVLRSKHDEPPVLAVAEDGSAVVPLLGGHHGAHRLAAAIGQRLGVAPALTTAGDTRLGIAFDEPPEGFVLAGRDYVASFTADVLNGAPVRVEGDAPWLEQASLQHSQTARHVIRVTDRAQTGTPETLIYYEKSLALGVGCERGAEGADMIALARETLNACGLAPEAVAVVASLDVKMDEPAVHETAAAFNAPARFFDAQTLDTLTPRLLTPSQVVYRAVGCHGVAEAAALAVAGREAVLVAPKRLGEQITCALARAPHPLIRSDLPGRTRGVLSIVGLGPGMPLWRTPEAQQTLEQAQDVVGYRKYLDMLGSLAEDKQTHRYELGEEVARVRHALDLAATGRQVVLVCSGDPGIYAMAALVFEELDRAEKEGRNASWRQSAVRVVPGVSAFQAAAARAGAPLGHDFAVISLSDLLTPWPVIERRLTAAATADFAVALYNPVSNTRIKPFMGALDIFRRHRAPETPVIIGTNLGRHGERVSVSSLGTLDASMPDMVSVVLVGACQTRVLPRRDADRPWVYTPRGYHAGEEEKTS